MNKYERLGLERKDLQLKGELPDWYTTAAWQMFSEKYAEYPGQTFSQRINKIASTLADYWPDPVEAYFKFQYLLWNNILVPSSPVLSNTGTDRGLSVSCSGSYIPDSVEGFYESALEIAMLSKNGFGTSAYLGDIRPSGTPIAKGGNAAGSLPVFKMLNQVASDISQGGVRRGSIACYIEIDHPDWDSIIDCLEGILPDENTVLFDKDKKSDGINVGWNITDAFIEKLQNQDADSIRRFQKALAFKMKKGKGYFFFPGKANRLLPKCFKDLSLTIKASNLCVEISLPSDKDHTFSCILSSLNLANPLSLDPGNIKWSINFLHCVAVDFLHKAKDIRGLERAVRFTQKAMALGLGTLGFHTMLQEKSIAMESMEAYLLNNSIFSAIRDAANEASSDIAQWYGEPLWCQGTGKAHTTLMAIAPNMSSALLAGGVSQGIEPIFSNTFVQDTAAGEVERINPTLLKLIRFKGLDEEKCLKELRDADGSCQKVNWLDDQEKEVFKTAFEINQEFLLRLASSRQRYIDQGQSLNLFFDSNEDEAYIAKIHQQAFTDPYIKGLYYIRSKSGIIASKGECEVCGS